MEDVELLLNIFLLLGLVLGLWWWMVSARKRLGRRLASFDTQMNGKGRIVEWGGECYVVMQGVFHGVDGRTLRRDGSYWQRSAELVLEKIAKIGSPKVLLLGLGGGTIGYLIHEARPEVELVVVEIDRSLAENVSKKLGLEGKMRIVIGDAMELEKLEQVVEWKYDAVYVDVYSDWKSLEEWGEADGRLLKQAKSVLKREVGWIFWNKPMHTRRACSGAVKLKEMLESELGQVWCEEVDDEARNFKNMIVYGQNKL
jgi:hypothetical protein